MWEKEEDVPNEARGKEEEDVQKVAGQEEEEEDVEKCHRVKGKGHMKYGRVKTGQISKTRK